MLASLDIENIAVIRKASIRFERGLNVFTGETGAGKTMLISAIDAVLGERVSREIIRTGEERAQVRALFEEIPRAARIALREMGFEDEDGSVLIHREISSNGKNSCRINGMPATAAMLKSFTSSLIHIHGQRDAGQLLRDERHIELIDTFGDHTAAFEAYRAAHAAWSELRRERDALDMDERQKAQRIDLLKYQIRELEAANLDDENELDELLARKKMIGASEKIITALSQAYSALDGDPEGAQRGVNDLFVTLCEGVGAAAEYMDSLEPAVRRLEEMRYELIEYAGELRGMLDGFEFDPRELDAIEYRLDELHKLGRKYGESIAEMLEYLQGAREELETIESSGRRIEELDEALEAALAVARERAAELTARRLEAAERFMRRVEEELAYLDMPSVSLSAAREDKPLGEDGADEFRFLVVTNVGEEPKPLSKIASGGEISRMMLAMKNVLADRDRIGTLIFDEVDIGVSGRAAGKIGRKLAEVAGARQVICVTHLAQVAAFADYHLLIQKEVEEGRTYTRVFELDEEARARELARITSGEKITETALQNARELMAFARSDKS